MAKKDYDSSIYKGITGKKPATTAMTRQQRIEAEMEGTYEPPKKPDPNSPRAVNKRGYSIHKMEDA